MPINISKDETLNSILQRNLEIRYKDRRRPDNLVIHVSDLIPSACLRKQYYSRKTPAALTSTDITNFVRGESNEFALTSLMGKDMGISQCRIEKDDVVFTPDILRRNGEDKEKHGDIVVELKSNSTGKRLKPSDDTFQSYLWQILFYMELGEVERGLIAIQYQIKDLNWIQRTEAGDIFCRPKDAPEPSLESFEIFLAKSDSVIRSLIHDLIIERRDRFKKALETNQIKDLPRLTEKQGSRYKCPSCPYYNTCQNVDQQSLDAITWNAEQIRLDPLKMAGVIKVDDGK